jgi:hypothetical protein
MDYDDWEQQYERERDDQEFMPGYEAAQSRLRLSMTCKDMVSNQPLELCILELAAFKNDGRHIALE